MKKLLLIIVFVISANSFSQTENTTTYYFVRHAEKVVSKTNKDPDLQPKGELRAHRWARVLKNIEFDGVYSTNYKRTIATANPTAESQNLKITTYHPIDIDYEEFKNKTKGKTVLIVGHSNTIPSFVNAMINQKKYADIEHYNNANLYVVTIVGNTIIDNVYYIE